MANITNPSQLFTRELQCKLILQSGTFNQGNNVKIINNLTINATVHKTLNNNFTQEASIIIYGMNKSDIAALSTLGYAPLIYEANKIELYAQYAGSTPSLCFSGYIIKAWAEFADPNRPMYFECQATYQPAIDNVTPYNASGSENIADVFKKYASNLGYSFINNGVTGQVNNLILTGSSISQIQQLAKQTNTMCVIDNNCLKIAPNGKSLNNEILNINSTSGLISYPTIDAWGVKFRIRYNPVLQLGQYIKLTTTVPIPKSTGQWYVYDMNSSLNNRHENWYTDIRTSYNNLINDEVQ